MSDYADLEITLNRWNADTYRVELRYSQPDSDADIRLAPGTPSLVRFDSVQLQMLALDAPAYGTLLGANLFGDANVKTAFAQARANAQSLDASLRLRLSIDSAAPELHALRWETLRDPADGSSLVTSERILFTRYLASQDWRRVKIKPQAALRALVFIANPSNLADYELAPVDAAGELERARSAMSNLTVTTLAANEYATLNTLSEKLRDDVDILYLVAHGAVIDGEPRLFLQDEQGRVHVTSGSDLVTRIGELQNAPRLVVLASCQSANMATGDNGALASLGPRLAAAGVSAVIAMQGNISMNTVTQFMPVFFKELARDGQIDRAMAAARAAVRDNADAWMPVLFMRLKSGRIWYVPGFGGERRSFEKFPALLDAIRGGRCTPILGSGISENLFGSRREIAARWAEEYRFPLAPFAREDLPEVAQYLAVNQSPIFPREGLGKYLRQEIWRRYGPQLAPDLQNAQLPQLIAGVGEWKRKQDPSDAHAVLAALPFPIFITTNPDNLLVEALKAAGKDPQVELCKWNEDMEFESIYKREPDYRPDEKRPLVYCLFGQFNDLDSMVVTEDDYFDYLIGVTSNKDLIPGVVRRALADSALLFLGFQLDDWNFRVLYRSIMSQQGGSRRKKHSHIAAQIDPEEGRILEPERARRYLESYFGDADISIYWGSAEDFVRDLQRQAEKK